MLTIPEDRHPSTSSHIQPTPTGYSRPSKRIRTTRVLFRVGHRRDGLGLLQRGSGSELAGGFLPTADAQADAADVVLAVQRIRYAKPDRR